MIVLLISLLLVFTSPAFAVNNHEWVPTTEEDWSQSDEECNPLAGPCEPYRTVPEITPVQALKIMQWFAKAKFPDENQRIILHKWEFIENAIYEGLVQIGENVFVKV